MYSEVHAAVLTGPVWVRLVRAGNTISGYYSADGTTWKRVGTTKTIAMSATAEVGQAVTARRAGTLSTAAFTNVAVLTSTPATLKPVKKAAVVPASLLS